jgi:hypothetical protein
MAYFDVKVSMGIGTGEYHKAKEAATKKLHVCGGGEQ